MRLRTKAAIILLFAVSLFSIATVYATNSRLKTNQNDISPEQSSDQIYYFKEVLDRFGASSVDEVIFFWVEGYKTRNGVYQYAVAGEELKKQLEAKWGKAEKSFWNIGGSSPWLADYEIISRNLLNPITCELKLRLSWESSAGPSEPSYDLLIISKRDSYWQIIDIISSR